MLRSKRVAAVIIMIAATLGATPEALSEQKITIRLVWDTPPQKPVFDCDDPEIRRKYPAQCPEGAILIGGGQSGGGGGGGCGVCDLIGGIIGNIPGVGGLL